MVANHNEVPETFDLFGPIIQSSAGRHDQLIDAHALLSSPQQTYEVRVLDWTGRYEIMSFEHARSWTLPNLYVLTVTHGIHQRKVSATTLRNARGVFVCTAAHEIELLIDIGASLHQREHCEDGERDRWSIAWQNQRR